jgi:Cd2+/Zn2+-exporting ATPase
MLDIDGIMEIKLNYATAMMTVTYDRSKISLTEIQSKLDKLGYQVLEHEIEDEKTFSLKNREFVFTITSGAVLFIGLAVMFFTFDPVIFKLYFNFNISNIIFLVSIFFGGFHVTKQAVKGLLNKRFVIDSLMIIGAAGAVLIDAFAEGAAVLFLFSTAELLEDYSVERSRNSLQELIEIAPKTAHVKTNNRFSRVPIESIKINDIVKIKPGERVSVDGVVIKGVSTINQAPITGESMPVNKAVGDSVFAGTINQHGVLVVKAAKTARDSTLAKIVNLVEAAEEQKSPTERFIDRFAKYYTPSVVVLAVLVVLIPPFLFNQPFEVWFYKALLLLLISCPCALALSTPIAIASGITSGAKNGVLFKGGVYIEKLAKIDTFAFDKTGTLTQGKPEIVDVITRKPGTDLQMLTIAGSLERHSSHPLGKAVFEYVKSKNAPLEEVEDFKMIPGKGIHGRIENTVYFAGSKKLFDKKAVKEWEDKFSKLEERGRTLVIVGAKHEIFGVIGISDKIRPSSQDLVRLLHRQGVKRTVMVTGDNARTAKAVASKIGLDEYHADLLPDQKVAKIKSYSGNKGTVAMVGDGVNDAPALAVADLGIAMGVAGSDTALEVADIALMEDDLAKVPYLLRLGRKTMEVVKQNIILAIGIKLLFAILVFPGLVTLWMAVAIGDMGVSLGVILNSLRLAGVK